MLYHYKRPGDWLWTPLETDSLAEEVARKKLDADWKYMIVDDPNVHSLAELLEMERARLGDGKRNAADSEMLAPDGTWGWIVVVACAALLTFVIFVPSRQGASGSGKFYIAGIALIWMSWGIRLIQASRAWKARHRHKT